MKRKRDSVGVEAPQDQPKAIQEEEPGRARKEKKKKKQKENKDLDEDKVEENKRLKTASEGARKDEKELEILDASPKQSKKEKRKEKKDGNEPGTLNYVAEGASSRDSALAKHPTILKKFQKFLKKKEKNEGRSNNDTSAVTKPLEQQPEEPISSDTQGLQPLPQPALDKSAAKPFLPLSSSLPTYHSTAITVSPSHSLPFSSLPLSTKLQARLSQHLKYHSAFAVQGAVIPLLLKPAYQRNDLLVSAPTGSGKTLSYMLPIIHDLSNRVITRLRGLVIVPTRELVSQVRDTAESLASGLKIGTAWGARGLDIERKLLIEEGYGVEGSAEGRLNSKVDILICTPGRLVEHITSTTGFTLGDLKWLVIDEADRLLAQSFQEWVGVVMKSLQSREDISGSLQCSARTKNIDVRGFGLRSTTAGDTTTKVILSATMTKDAGKLSALNLRKPKLVIIEDKPSENIEVEDEDGLNELFSVPSTLSEHYISIPSLSDKPLLLESLIRLYNLHCGTLVFTRSNENAARLHRLLELMAKLDNKPTRIGLITGEIPKANRKKTLSLFKRNEIDILVASDLISRGLDVPDIKHIINYDIPSTARAYVHRVGRTARAGNAGDAWSLVGDSEARWFWKNIGKGIRRGEEKVIKKVKLAADETQRERYEKALTNLGEEVKGLAVGEKTEGEE